MQQIMHIEHIHHAMQTDLRGQPMSSPAKITSRDWLDWPFFEPSHRLVCQALDRFVTGGGLDGIDHSDVDGSCRKIVRALGAAGLLDCAVAAPDGDVTTIDSRSIHQFQPLPRSSAGCRNIRGLE